MKPFIILLILAGIYCAPQAQTVITPPASRKAMVAEWIGLTKVQIEYSRPGVKGREGKIFWSSHSRGA